MQVVYSILGGELRVLKLPRPHDYVVPGVPWGSFDVLMTPAYWRSQAWQHDALGTYQKLRLGNSLHEEVAACLLGGYGMPAELGLAAFERLRTLRLLDAVPSASVVENALSEPFRCHSGRTRRYRFPRQKAKYLVACLARLRGMREPDDDLEFRDALAELPGIGLKTASWIVRNYRASNSVAIIDVHVLRAGQRAGFFKPHLAPQTDYRELESSFLNFADAMETPAALLDSLIWDQMRRMPSTKVYAHTELMGQMSLSA